MIGRVMGPYRVLAKLGEGGMGEVYRARDTKLDRDVAIKVLPESLAGDRDRIARFQREAKTLAALNHLNIAAIYGLEEADSTKALVMELVEGPTLADRIAQGAIPVDEALPIAKQIAEALEAAHEQGIIHRDLKPANIKLRPDGVVKVLDFGLAKALEPTGAMSPEMSQAPTITTPAMTQAGMILGTAAYMSPEQAKGRTVDKRSDVWAFGAVLYEMLTGRRAFDAEDVSETLAAVLRAEVDWARLPEELSPVLGTYIRRCLQKDPKQRIRDVGDVSLALEGAFEMAGSQAVESATVPEPAVWRRTLPVAVALVVGGLTVWGLMRPAPQPPAPVERFVVTTPATVPFSPTGSQDLAISPDGTRVIYLASANDGTNHLYVRPVDQLEGFSLFSSPAAINTPTVSPDGAWVVFANQADRTWKKVSILGGPPLTLFTTPTFTAPRGASWGPDDTIIFAQNGSGLFRGPAGGGESAVLTTPDAARGEVGHFWPEVLPGGEAVLFTVAHGVGTENMELAVLDLATMEQRVLLAGGSHAQYAATGQLVYGADGTLLAVPFDLARLEVTGAPVPLLDGVMTAPSGAVEFSLSANGSVLYASGDSEGNVSRTLVWTDRQGREEPLAAPPRTYQYPRLSLDGTRVALDVRDQEQDIWIWDLARETSTRLTFDPGQDQYPVWTPDGTRVLFSSTAGGRPNLYWKAADGTGMIERLTESANVQFGYSFSPDGESLVFREGQPNTGTDLRLLSLTGDRGAETLVATAFSELNWELSPDGGWMAYQSNQSGQMEVYVRPFPNVDDGQWQISTSGGTHPLWASNGRELVYRRGAAMVAVPVQMEPSFTPATPEVLFEGTYYTGPGRSYDVSPDGQRFLMIKEGGEAEDTSAPPSLILVQNWHEELKRLVPVP